MVAKVEMHVAKADGFTFYVNKNKKFTFPKENRHSLTVLKGAIICDSILATIRE